MKIVTYFIIRMKVAERWKRYIHNQYKGRIKTKKLREEKNKVDNKSRGINK